MVLDPSGYKDVTQDPEVMVRPTSFRSACAPWGLLVAASRLAAVRAVSRPPGCPALWVHMAAGGGPAPLPPPVCPGPDTASGASHRCLVNICCGTFLKCGSDPTSSLPPAVPGCPLRGQLNFLSVTRRPCTVPSAVLWPLLPPHHGSRVHAGRPCLILSSLFSTSTLFSVQSLVLKLHSLQGFLDRRDKMKCGEPLAHLL